MSWYNTIVLSFCNSEWDSDQLNPPQDLKPLVEINKWLVNSGFKTLTDLNEAGHLGSNAVLLGGCYNYLDVEEFCLFVQSLPWRFLEDVQILFWGDNDSKFSVIEFPMAEENH